MRKQSALIAGVLLIISCPMNADERLTLGVSPTVAFAPATVMVRATVEANPENRAIQIVAESQDFYRSSEIPLDGDRAPRTSVVEYKSLPGGSYTITAVLIRAHDHVMTSQPLNILVPDRRE